MDDLELENDKKLEIVKQVLNDFEAAKLEFTNIKAAQQEVGPEETSPQQVDEILEEFRKNPVPLPRPPNPAILKHERLRKVQNELFVLKRDLTNQGVSADQLEIQVQNKRKELMDEIDKEEAAAKQPDTSKAKDGHMAL